MVIPDSGGKIRVESVNKQYGHPEYRGIFEIDLVDKALHIINELPLEEYYIVLCQVKCRLNIKRRH